MDSMAAVAFTNRQGGPLYRILCSSAQALWKQALSRGGWTRAHWVPREENNQANFLSNFSIKGCVSGLRVEVVEQLWEKWFKLSVWESNILTYI